MAKLHKGGDRGGDRGGRNRGHGGNRGNGHRDDRNGRDDRRAPFKGKSGGDRRHDDRSSKK